jgi:glycosyltransferase A (GT-A) superfamily protein (DUF2064 family)
VPPALVVMVDDLENGLPGLTDDPEVAGRLLAATLAMGRRVPGVGRVLLFHPVGAEARLTSRALGYRLWPQDGETPGARYANAFRQAGELGYDGAVVVRPEAACVPPAVLGEAAAVLAARHGAVAPDASGGVAFLALQDAQPTLLVDAGRPRYDDLLTRARQQRVDLVELPSQPLLTAATLDGFLGPVRAGS